MQSPAHVKLQFVQQHGVGAFNSTCRSRTRKRLCLIVRAEKSSGSLLEKAKALVSKKSDDEDRFKWDAANARWVRVKADRDVKGTYTTDKWLEGGGATITPLSGSPYVVWPVIHSKLVKRGLKSIPAEEAFQLQKKGVTMLDIRPDYQWKAQRIEGAINIPTFRPVAGSSNWDRVKKVVMGALAMKATESDPDFRKKAAQQLDKRKKVIVYCSRGGTLKTGFGNDRKFFKDDPERMFGIESRSLKACYELLEAGFTNVLHLEGGLSQWRYDGYPVESD